MSDFKRKMLKEGLFIYTHWHTILIIPPLCITQSQLEEGFTILDKALGLVDDSLKPSD